MGFPVLSGTGAPPASVFASASGTPLYIDLASAIAYFLNSSNVVTQLAGTGGSGSFHVDGGNASSIYTSPQRLNGGGA